MERIEIGNRAVITYGRVALGSANQGVYLHWDGEPDRVNAIVQAAKDLGYRNPCSDDGYGMARIASLACYLANENGLSVGIGPMNTLDRDNGDNGVYVIGDDWTVRQFRDGHAYRGKGLEVNEVNEEVKAHLLRLVLATRAEAARDI